MKRYVFDIELYPNYLLVLFKEFRTDNWVEFELSEYVDNINELKSFLTTRHILISFNGLHYDNVLLNCLFSIYNTKKFNTYDKVLLELKRVSDDIIDDIYIGYSKYKYNKKFNSLDVDLMCYWSKMLRLSKKISLKGLMVQLNMPLIQELPYEPNRYLLFDEIGEVIDYCHNDVNGTEQLAIVMSNDDNTGFLQDTGSISLRFQIAKERGFDCYSWDTIKLASEELLNSYCNQTNKDPKDVRKYFFTKNTIYIKELLEDVEFGFKTMPFNNLLNNLMKSVDTLKESVFFKCRQTAIKLTYGVGGLHSVNKNEKYVSTENLKIITSDVASLYPTIIENYKLFRFFQVLERYSQIKLDRLKAKREGNKLYNLFYKLVLNGISGLLDNNYSWLYFPEEAMKLRLMGQLMLTKLIEEASLAGFKVISSNTDGIEVILESNRIEEYYEIVKKVEEHFNIQFEHEFYDKIIYYSVNDYLAIVKQPTEILPLEQIKIKQKGSMVTKPKLGSSVDNLIIPKALNYYFIYGIPVKQTIEEETNIYLFCSSPKADKKFQVWHNNIKQQRLNRFFVTTNTNPKGAYLYKQKEGGNMENMLVGYSVELLNNCLDKNAKHYDINYNYYINKCNELIEDIEPKQLSLF